MLTAAVSLSRPFAEATAPSTICTNSSLAPLLAETEAALDVFAEIAIVATNAAEPANGFAEVHFEALRCPLMIDNYQSITKAVTGTTFASIALKLSGKALIAIGYTYLKIPDVGGGYAGGGDVEIKVSSNLQASLGTLFEGLAATIDSTKSTVTDRLAECANLSAQLKIIENQELILEQLGVPSSGGGDASGGGCSVGPKASTSAAWYGLMLLFLCGRRRRSLGRE